LSARSDQVALVTGTSSGIGEALAQELIRRGWRVFGVSRRSSAIGSPLYSHLRADLREVATLAARLEPQVEAAVSDPSLRRFALVNNAAGPGLLGPLDGVKAEDLLELYAVNVAAPVSLMGWFVRRSRPGLALRMVNVSTGAATAAFPGLGAYGSSKAALRMAGMVLASELEARDPEDPARDITILSYEPGIVDTEMQAAVRGSSKETVPMVEMFRQFEAEGRLVPPKKPAAEIADYLEADGHARFTERRLGVPPTQKAAG